MQAISGESLDSSQGWISKPGRVSPRDTLISVAGGGRNISRLPNAHSVIIRVPVVGRSGAALLNGGGEIGGAGAAGHKHHQEGDHCAAIPAGGARQISKG